jgi:hypothetical protein
MVLHAAMPPKDFPSFLNGLSWFYDALMLSSVLEDDVSRLRDALALFPRMDGIYQLVQRQPIKGGVNESLILEALPVHRPSGLPRSKGERAKSPIYPYPDRLTLY